MSKQVTHWETWDGGTESDCDPPDQLFCLTPVAVRDPLTAYNIQYVTCKRCLRYYKVLMDSCKPNKQMLSLETTF